MRLRSAAACAGLIMLALLTSAGFAQTLSNTQETRSYGFGVGRIVWTIPAGIEVAFAVPHWTAGPRLLCASPRYFCELEVLPRNIAVSDDEHWKQLVVGVAPHAERIVEKTLGRYRHGLDDSVAYTGFTDSRPAARFRHYTGGYAHRGPAFVRFHAGTNDPFDAVAILDLVLAARPIDALEMWAYRFADYKAVCEERFPAHGGANDRAFAASPFAQVDVVRFFMQRSPARSEEDIRKELTSARQGFGQDFDRRPEAERQSFCERLPQFLVEAAKDVPAR